MLAVLVNPQLLHHLLIQILLLDYVSNVPDDDNIEVPGQWEAHSGAHVADREVPAGPWTKI